MKKASFIFSSLFAAGALFLLSFTAGIGVASYKVDTKGSMVNWKGYKVTGEHFGAIQIKNGKLDFNNDLLTGGSFEIDMTTITVTDIQGEYAKKLENHLKSDDFFGVQNYPVAKFVITKVVSKGTPGSYKVIGDITIKGTTKEIRFDATVKESNGTAIAEAAIKLDRADFNVRYGSGSFFDNLGDKTIYDEFDLNLKIVASK